MFTTTTFKEFFTDYAKLDGVILTDENAEEYFEQLCNVTDFMFDNADDRCLSPVELLELYHSDEEVELTVHETSQDWEFIFHTDEAEEYVTVLVDAYEMLEMLGLR